MRSLLIIATLLGIVNLGESFTKYGRSCKDIGCPSTQQCVMETDPCSYYQRQGECGAYPTCKKISSGAGASRTCSTFVCPPSQVCRMDGATPKCVNDASKSGHVGYDTQSAAGSLDPNQAPSAPPANGGGNLYPSVPRRGETTPRPNIGQQPAGGGAGYQGGQIGSGYPGGGYPQQVGGYAQGGGYQQQGGGYQQPGGYPQGYPQGGYPQGGYNQHGSQQYPNGYQNGYNPYQQQYPQKSEGNSLSDKISAGLKSIGTSLLKDYLSKALSGGGRN